MACILIASKFGECLVQLVRNRLVLLLLVHQLVCFVGTKEKDKNQTLEVNEQTTNLRVGRLPFATFGPIARQTQHEPQPVEKEKCQ